MVADMIKKKRLKPAVTKLFIRDGKLKISLVFITQSHFIIPKNVRLNFIHYFIMNIPDLRELQQISFNHSSAFAFN